MATTASGGRRLDEGFEFDVGNSPFPKEREHGTLQP